MEEHGHCKDGAADSTGAVCMAGALWAVCGDNNSLLENECVAIAKHLGIPLRKFNVGATCDVLEWNDRPETTKDMAVAALIGAALQQHTNNKGD
jgi:hypothetical protein